MSEQAGRQSEGVEPIGWTWIGSDGHPAIVARIGVTTSLQRPAQRPADAVPLVPATDAPQFPALDSIEALRFAADVCDQHNRRLGRDWHQHPFPPRELRERIRDLEREAETNARADAEREARIEKLAEAVYIQHELRVRGDGKWQPWDELLDYTQGLWREDAAALDDLGYRLDPSQARP